MKPSFSILLIGLAFTLAACNTVKGIGQDVQSAGNAIERAARWRYLDHGEPGQDPASRKPNPDFVLNQPRYAGASILIARKNFGCGSSREHAPWALDQYGFRAILAPSFADIFFNNCFKNGLLPIVLPEATIDMLFNEVAAFPGYELTIDLERQVIVRPQGEEIPFDVIAFRKYCLLNGFDDIGLTLRHADKIRAYEAERLATKPWLAHTLVQQH
jgi:3-isopropylmalate/(R)-2-methylmalate dehydratase small subunit